MSESIAFRIVDEFLQTSETLSPGLIPWNATPILQLLYLLAFYIVAGRIGGEALFYFTVKLFPERMKDYALLPFFTEEVTILVFGDAKTGKTTLLEMFTTPDDVNWRSDLSPGRSGRYRNLYAGYIWHGGKEKKEPIKRTVIDSDADVFTSAAGSGNYDIIPCDPDVVLLCFSLVNRSSFENIADLWYTELRKRNVQAPIVLVGTHLDKRGVVDLDSYLDRGTNRTYDVEDFVTRREGLTLMKKIAAISYIEFSSKSKRGISDLLYKTTQAGLFYKRKHKGLWLNFARRVRDTVLMRAPAVPTPPPPPPLPLFAGPSSQRRLQLGPLSLRGPHRHERVQYGCLRNRSKGLRIYYYIKCFTRWPPHLMFIIVVVEREADLLEVNLLADD